MNAFCMTRYTRPFCCLPLLLYSPIFILIHIAKDSPNADEKCQPHVTQPPILQFQVVVLSLSGTAFLNDRALINDNRSDHLFSKRKK